MKGGSYLASVHYCAAPFDDDIKGAILMLLNKGYETIYLQGHSLGSAKSVYTYQKMKQQNEIEILSHIKAVSLLSIVDVPRTTRVLLSEYFDKAIAESQEMVLENKAESLIKREYFLHPICAKNFLLCSELNGELDVAPFGEQDTDLSALNQIDCKLFMCWGKERDMIVQSPEELKNLLETKIKNMNLKVDFIEGTGHNYHFKEKETAQKMITFLRND